MGDFECRPWLAALALAALVLPGWAAARQAPPRPGPPAMVRVRDWARDNGFRVQWLKLDEILQLAKGDNKLVLTANSREARINGVRVWLLKPFEYREGAGYLAQLDLDATIAPVLRPPRHTGKIRHICLDPGHGGKDPGFRIGAQEEKRFSLALAYELKDQLSRAGYKVTLTRTNDTFVDLPERPIQARKEGADLFLSLHFNATEGDRNEARGAEVYCLTPAGASSTADGSDGPSAGSLLGNRTDAKNLLLAYHVQKALLRTPGTEDRGVRRARFAVLRDATMPAILIEAGFLSHPVEGRKIQESAYRRALAKAITQGVRAYQRIVESKK